MVKAGWRTSEVKEMTFSSLSTSRSMLRVGVIKGVTLVVPAEVNGLRTEVFSLPICVLSRCVAVPLIF